MSHRRDAKMVTVKINSDAPRQTSEMGAPAMQYAIFPTIILAVFAVMIGFFV